MLGRMAKTQSGYCGVVFHCEWMTSSGMCYQWGNILTECALHSLSQLHSHRTRLNDFSAKWQRIHIHMSTSNQLTQIGAHVHACCTPIEAKRFQLCHLRKQYGHIHAQTPKHNENNYLGTAFQTARIHIPRFPDSTHQS